MPDPNLLCSMCPTVTLSDQRGPRLGWQCQCGAVMCSHHARCPRCHTSRYVLESAGQIKNGRYVTPFENWKPKP